MEFRCGINKNSCIFILDTSYLLDAALDLLADESFQLPTKGNEICISSAKSLIVDLKKPTENTEAFCKWLFTKLSDIVHAGISDHRVNKEVLWPKLYQLQVSLEFEQKWTSHLTLIDVPVEPIFYQHYTRIIFDNLVKQKIPTRKESTVSATQLTFEEENAIYYVGGYVIKALKEKEGDEELLHGMNHLIDKDVKSTSEISASVWVKEISRGRLIQVTQQAQQVFVAIEMSVRTHLRVSNAHKLDETSRKKIRELVFADSDVQFYWCLTGMTFEIGDERAEELLEMCIEKWITIRGFSFANSILEIYKQDMHCGTGKAKALRKTL